MEISAMAATSHKSLNWTSKIFGMKLNGEQQIRRVDRDGLDMWN